MPESNETRTLPAGRSLAVIPARGGSKRILHKNIVPLGGVPMIAHTIRAALDSGVFDEVVVSTDCPRIEEAALDAGAAVPFRRDTALADDFTPVSMATIDALDRLDPEGERFAYVAQLMANCPLRTAATVRSSFRQFVELGGEFQITVARFGWLNPWWAAELDEQRRVRHIFNPEAEKRSQDFGPLYCPTGAIWWAQSAALRREKTFLAPGRTAFELPWREAIDIDDHEDFEMAELILRASTNVRRAA